MTDEGQTMDEIPGADERRRELREIDAKYGFFYEMLGGSVLVGIGILIGWLLFADKEGYVVNLFTDGIGIVVTIFVLDRWTRRRDEKRGQQKLKEDLIFQLRSQINAEAIKAVEALRRYGWLYDGSLCGTDLRGANLAGAHLTGANLGNTRFQGANLRNAILIDANFTGSTLTNVDLQEAILVGAILNGANLQNAKLEKAVTEMDLMIVKLGISADENTVLPDGSKFQPRDSFPFLFRKPTPDLSKFTGPAASSHRLTRVVRKHNDVTNT